VIKKGEIWQPLYIGGKWSDLFRLPGNALKVWLLHYSMEGKGKRRSWPTIETIMEECDLSHNTVHNARSWLVDNKCMSVRLF
jgi:Helix-turn-helix domain